MLWGNRGTWEGMQNVCEREVSSWKKIRGWHWEGKVVPQWNLKYYNLHILPLCLVPFHPSPHYLVVKVQCVGDNVLKKMDHGILTSHPLLPSTQQQLGVGVIRLNFQVGSHWPPKGKNGALRKATLSLAQSKSQTIGLTGLSVTGLTDFYWTTL